MLLGKALPTAGCPQRAGVYCVCLLLGHMLSTVCISVSILLTSEERARACVWVFPLSPHNTHTRARSHIHTQLAALRGQAPWRAPPGAWWLHSNVSAAAHVRVWPHTRLPACITWGTSLLVLHTSLINCTKMLLAMGLMGGARTKTHSHTIAYPSHVSPLPRPPPPHTGVSRRVLRTRSAEEGGEQQPAAAEEGGSEGAAATAPPEMEEASVSVTCAWCVVCPR